MARCPEPTALGETPIGRLVTMAEIADATDFLLRNTGFLLRDTGIDAHDLNIDGGLPAI